MDKIQSQYLFDMHVVVADAVPIGETHSGRRHVVSVREGTFTGPELRGRVLSASGGDWLVSRVDDVMQLDARLVLETDDHAKILMRYTGLRHGATDVMARLAAGQTVDPSEYYFRTTPYFETSSTKYSWLNRIVSIGVGKRSPNAVGYRVFQVM